MKTYGVTWAEGQDGSYVVLEALGLYRDEMGETGPVVRVAGRLDSLRSQGKTTFGHLEDATGRIQVYFRRDVLGDAYELVRLLDLDDHVGIEGRLFRTKMGEVTVRAESVTLLAKSLRPLPRGKQERTEAGVVVHGGLREFRVFGGGNSLPPLLDDPVAQCWLTPPSGAPARCAWPVHLDN